MAIYGTNQKDTINAADGVTGESDIIFGLDGDDTIYGLGGDDIMHGGKGDDTFYGGAGYDEVDYIDSDKGVTVDLVKGSGSGGTADGDTYFSVENVTGSLYRDRLTGNGLDNTLRGLDGGDTLSGLDGPDVLDGGNGDDYLYGETQDDILYGRDNDDYLVGGAGADQLFGGNGLDSVSYWASPEGVTVSLISNLGCMEMRRATRSTTSRESSAPSMTITFTATTIRTRSMAT